MCGIIIKYGMVISLLSCIAHQTMAQYAGKVFVDETRMDFSTKEKNCCKMYQSLMV